MLKVRLLISNLIRAIFIILSMATFKFKLYHSHFLFFFFLAQEYPLASLPHPRSFYHFSQWNNFYQLVDLYLNNFLNSLHIFIQQIERFQTSFFYISLNNHIYIYQFNQCLFVLTYYQNQLDWDNLRNHCSYLLKWLGRVS